MVSLFCTFFAAMQFFSGPADDLLLEESAEIKLLTWNILGLPNDQVAVRPWEDRLDGIAQKIGKVDADVVVLQECFVKDLSLGLFERLKKQYSHIYLHLEEESTPLPSGLALFSKLPVSDFRFSPHPDLLDGEKNSKMGTMDFVLLNKRKKPIAHIGASHFHGSSNCEWRVGLTDDGQRLSYAKVREQEAMRALSSLSSSIPPAYLCGDLNVDRRSTEYYTSSLNAQINNQLLDCMGFVLKMEGTNTNFWKHEKGIEKAFPSLSKQEALKLANEYKKLYEEKLILLLAKDPWIRPLSEFDASFFSTLMPAFDLKTEQGKMLFSYFKMAAIDAIKGEERLWKFNQNEGLGPNVSIGKVIEIRALPIEESLDYVLGVNPSSMITKIEILQGYDDASFEKTLSDHHPVVAKIVVKER